MSTHDFDVLVIGSGPAGQKAAIQAAKAGRRVAIIDSERRLGGACVQRGTIPSKTLRESALGIVRSRRYAGATGARIAAGTEMSTLVDNLQTVIGSHHDMIEEQLRRNGVTCLHGRARFLAADVLQVESLRGERRDWRASHVIIATGSYPRVPPGVPVDHEHIFDSDSILSMLYLPASLIVLGGGIIASEYASIFASLGVAVTLIDRYPRPLGFMDAEIVDCFLRAFAAAGGVQIGGVSVSEVHWDGISEVVVNTEDGREFRAEKLLCAAGRVANVDGLDLAAAGLSLSAQGHIPVDAQCCTAVPTIYAVGDVMGPPSLASASMEQGRRAAAAVLGIDLGAMSAMIPTGIYAIPEISSVGLDEAAACKAGREVLVGRALFAEIARGHISANTDGMLKMVCAPDGALLGVQIVGEGATELIHIAQLGLLAGFGASHFVDNIFNFPTLAEAYRVAALKITAQM